MFVRSTAEADNSVTVDFCEQSAFETFMMRLNGDMIHASLAHNSTVTDHGNGWHSVSVNTPQDGFSQGFPRAYNASSVNWTTAADGPGDFAAFQGWAYTTTL